MSTTTSTPSPGHVVGPEAPARTGRAAVLLQRQGALVVLVVLCVAAAVQFDSFATGANLTNIAVQASFLAVVALGMTFVIMTGGIDLSVGSVFALGGVLAAWASQFGVLAAVVVPLLACGLIGLVQGLLIARGGLEPFIVTLAGLLFARGVLLRVTDGGTTTYRVPPDSAFRQLAQGTCWASRCRSSWSSCCTRRDPGAAPHLVRTHRAGHRRPAGRRGAHGAAGRPHQGRDVRGVRGCSPASRA
jgi:ribose transport system permease protein